jgi:hypothetical protein
MWAVQQYVLVYQRGHVTGRQRASVCMAHSPFPHSVCCIELSLCKCVAGVCGACDSVTICRCCCTGDASFCNPASPLEQGGHSLLAPKCVALSCVPHKRAECARPVPSSGLACWGST